MFGTMTATFATLAAAVLYGLQGPCETPGTGAGGGAAAPAPAAATPSPDQAGVAEPPTLETPPTDAAAPIGEDDHDDDAAPTDDDVADHLPETQLRTRHRRTQRFVQRLRPIADRLRDPATGRLMPVERVDQMVRNASEFEVIDRILKASPKAVQALMDAQRELEGGTAAAGGAPAVEEPPAFNEADWPFETETPEGKRLLQQAKQQHDLVGLVQQLQRQIADQQTQAQTRQVGEVEQQWKQQTFTAAAEVDELYRPMFVNAVAAQFQLLKASGQLTRASVKDVIDRQLATVRQAKKTQTRQTLTRQSATVAANASLPATPRPGTVVPASGSQTTKRETIADAKKSFLGRYAS